MKTCTTLTTTALVTLLALPAFAETPSANMARQLADQGFADIEVEREYGMLYVEADRGGRTLYLSYDLDAQAVVTQVWGDDDDPWDEDYEDDDEEYDRDEYDDEDYDEDEVEDYDDDEDDEDDDDEDDD